MSGSAGPILIVGAGAMGGALIAGWLESGAFPASDLMIRDPAPGARALASQAAGARLNPPDAMLSMARTLLLAVKPARWREVAVAVAPHLAPDAVVVSIVAGVPADPISKAFGGRRVARAMPTTAAAIGKGTASLYASDAEALRRAHCLFEPLGDIVELAAEDQLHAATAASGSAPAYFYAFAEALADAGVAAGLGRPLAEQLARSTLTGAAALMGRSDESPAKLRAAVTSPGGTTQAALEVLNGERGLGPLLARAVAAAVARSRELGAQATQ